ncbi:glycosyl transferase [Polaribacter pacificus]|uniref:Glycosyl transferase n=1 Tax=Polaribacter pacificus TaxID=1775173 RepID=A0A917I1I9_9FLAO|nr:sugar transferase [Polaribacter pacificus]GGH01630.1 glycosyl transferase [Polaribacter pacificus]
MKQLFDTLMSLLGLIVLLPLLIMIFFLVYIKMPGGSPLFIQERIGKKGKLFKMIKFRTMIVDQSGSSVSIAGESRITPLGVKLRKYKIDELPALWNVLKGDMSIVGPRPDVPGYADKLDGEDRLILKLKPGITGPASLKYSNEEEILATVDNPIEYNNKIIYPDKVKINLDYYYNRTFIGDIKIIINTVFRTNY